jgi:hypothetical protein
MRCFFSENVIILPHVLAQSRTARSLPLSGDMWQALGAAYDRCPLTEATWASLEIDQKGYAHVFNVKTDVALGPNEDEYDEERINARPRRARRGLARWSAKTKCIIRAKSRVPSDKNLLYRVVRLNPGGASCQGYPLAALSKA